jgi:hypothetical protein
VLGGISLLGFAKTRPGAGFSFWGYWRSREPNRLRMVCLSVPVSAGTHLPKGESSMFGKLAADALGLSDIGSVIKPEDYNKVDSDDYVMHEDEEKIYFLIKSKSDEYCFTNRALIHLDGTSAVSKKRMLKRYSYASYPISHVYLETAGTVDMDVEIKFHMGGEDYSIDVHKKHIEEIKDLYKALYKIAEITRENEVALDNAKSSLAHATQALGRNSGSGVNPVEAFKEITQAANGWLVSAHQKYIQKDFGPVFEKYIHN